MRVAASSDGRILSAVDIASVSADFSVGMLKLKELAEKLNNGKAFSVVVCGVAGPLNEEKTMITNAPHLEGWHNRPLKSELEKAFDVPVFLENDAALAALGEAVFGAGKGYSTVAYLTISTGVGGARIVNGKIDENAFGFEPGHQIIDSGRTLEELISGSGLEKRFGKKPEEINDDNVWEEAARYLAVGVNNISVIWSPEVIVIGGAVASNRISLERVEFYLGQILKIFPKMPILKKAELGDQSGLYGGLALLNKIHNR